MGKGFGLSDVVNTAQKVMAKPSMITIKTPLSISDVMPRLQPVPPIYKENDVVVIPKVIPQVVVNKVEPIKNDLINDDMSIFSKVGGLIKKGTTAVKKATAFVSKASANPLQAASELLQGGGASKSGTPKVSTVAVDTQGPSRSAVTQGKTTSDGFMQKAMNFIKTYWMYIIGGFVVLFVVWWFFFKKKKMAARRRRTAPARAARARNRRRTPIRRKK
jgi:hypothetical protein